MRRLATMAALAVAIAGCATGDGTAGSAAPSTSSTTSSTTSTTLPPGPERFIAEAKTLDFGKKDMASGSDDALLGVGNVVCDGFGDGLNFGQVVRVLIQTDAKPSTSEATTFTKSAVRNLCPQYQGLVPA